MGRPDNGYLSSGLILEIGCGNNPVIKNSLKLDIRGLPNINIVCDASDLSRFIDDSFDGIFASHILEHIHWGKTKSVLKEWFRVLKPGGWMRIHAPCLKKISEAYLNKKLDGYTGKIFDTSLAVFYIYGGNERSYPPHQAGWDADYFTTILQEVGFREVYRLTESEGSLEFQILTIK